MISSTLSFWRKVRMLRHLVGWSGAISIARHESGEGLLPLRLKGYDVVVRRGTSDISTMEKVFWHREYEAPFPIDPDVIVDAGANIGMATLYYHRAYPRARIVAIEPEPSNFEILRKNCGGLDRVTLLNAALWPVSTSLALADPQAEKWAFVFKEGGAGGTPTTTIPEILQRLGADKIDILKIDIEGGERELFNRDPGSWLPHIGVIVIELHDRMEAGCAQTFYRAIGTRSYRHEVQGENIFIKFDPEPVAAAPEEKGRR
jgi:FkbM family methyltransferase